jgi:transposase
MRTPAKSAQSHVGPAWSSCIPEVERQVPYVRGNFFAGEDFVDLADAQRRAVEWCQTTAGMRVHGTTQLHPAEVFAIEEAPQ